LPCLSMPVLCPECLDNARLLLIMQLPATSETVRPKYSFLKPSVVMTLFDPSLRSSPYHSRHPSLSPDIYFSTVRLERWEGCLSTLRSTACGSSC
jgi:hypothetical protein